MVLHKWNIANPSLKQQRDGTHKFGTRLWFRAEVIVSFIDLTSAQYGEPVRHKQFQGV